MSVIASVHGRAARNGELRQSQAGKPWSRLSIAVEAGMDRETKEPITMWVQLVAFATHAETLAQVEKGQMVTAIGRLEVNRWTTREGETRDDLQLVVETLLTARSARSGNAPRSEGRGKGRVGPRSDSEGADKANRGTYDPAAQYEAANKIQGRADFDDELPF